MTTINQIKDYRTSQDSRVGKRVRRSSAISQQEEGKAVAQPYFSNWYHSISILPPSLVSDSSSPQLSASIRHSSPMLIYYTQSPGESSASPHTQEMHTHLANSADFSSVPATVCAAVAHERGVTTEHDVQNHPQAPQITPLVVERGLLHEDFHHFRCHVFCRATLRNQIQASFQREGQIKTRLRFIIFHSLYQVPWCKSRS